MTGPPSGTTPRTVLIVSPHFPPTDAVDMHRVRLSLPYLSEFGWRAVVLAVDPERAGRGTEPLLLETVPADVPVHRVPAFAERWTRKVGLSAISLRAFPFLYREGARLIRERRPDLVFISTTMFHAMALGRLWKRRFGVPFVVDMQDPWVNDYARAERSGGKHGIARRIHRILEPWTMRDVGGIVAVSKQYHVVLRRKYPWIREEHCLTLPFGAAQQDFGVARQAAWTNRFFSRDDGMIHGCYVGCLGPAMRHACGIICRALRIGLDERPETFRRLRLHFIGTDYAPGEAAKETIRPIALQHGLGEYIQEQPCRVPYFSALNLLGESDFLLVPGSDDPSYTASKIYPYILARKPLLAVFHQSSSAADVLLHTGAGETVVFAESDDPAKVATSLAATWQSMLERLPYTPATDWSKFEHYTAREMTRRQCDLFDAVAADGSRNTRHSASGSRTEGSFA